MKPNDKSLLLKKLAERVKELRVQKGVTQSQAYADTGIHFGRIEQGKRDVSYTTLVMLAEYLEVEIKDLV
jgi:transcriptional regulator with XRE-family HTH domain